MEIGGLVWELLCFLVDTAVTIPTLLYYWIEGIILACIPACLRYKKDISGHVVVITGAASGLGRLLARRFAGRNCYIALWDLNEEENNVTQELMADLGARSRSYTVDVSDRQQVADTAVQVLEDFGRIDILVNNAGIVNIKLFTEADTADMCKVMNVNALAHMYTTKAFLPSMLAQSSGHIVSIASSAGVCGVNYLTDYCASKYAVVGFMDALSYELNDLGRRDITTTTICTYKLDTDMFRGCTSKFYRLIPVLKASDVADRIMMAVLLNERVVYIPRILYTTVIVKSMVPVKCFWAILTYLGMNRI